MFEYLVKFAGPDDGWDGYAILRVDTDPAFPWNKKILATFESESEAREIRQILATGAAKNRQDLRAKARSIGVSDWPVPCNVQDVRKEPVNDSNYFSHRGVRTYRKRICGNRLEGGQMKKPMSKGKEFDLIEATITRLPASYLKDILEHERFAIRRAIEEDRTFIDLAGTLNQITNARAELAAIQDRIKEAKEQLAAVESWKAPALRDIAEIRERAQRILTATERTQS